MIILQLESFIAENEKLIKARFDDPKISPWKEYVANWLKLEVSDKPQFYSQFEKIIHPKVVQIGNSQTMHEEQMKHAKLLLESLLKELREESLKPEKLKETLNTLDSIIVTYSNTFPNEGNDFLFLQNAYQKCIYFAFARFGKTENIMMLSAHHYDWSELNGDKLKDATRNIVAKAKSLKQIIQAETNSDEKTNSDTQFANTTPIPNVNIFGKNINFGNNSRIESNEQNSTMGEKPSYPRLSLIVAAIVGIFVIAGVVLAYYEFYYSNSSHQINELKNPTGITNASQSTKSIAVIRFEDATNEGRIVIPIDFQRFNHQNMFQDKIRMIGAFPSNGLIEIKLDKVNIKQYNESLFDLDELSTTQPIPPKYVDENGTITILPKLMLIASLTNEYQNRNDTHNYIVPIGNVTFQFNYSSTLNYVQTSNFTQQLAIWVKGCEDSQNRDIPCK